ncbi:MAG: hypothetical protein WCI52_01110 [bacterium]
MDFNNDDGVLDPLDPIEEDETDADLADEGPIEEDEAEEAPFTMNDDGELEEVA